MNMREYWMSVREVEKSLPEDQPLWMAATGGAVFLADRETAAKALIDGQARDAKPWEVEEHQRRQKIRADVLKARSEAQAVKYRERG